MGCGCRDDAEEWGRSPPNCPESPLGWLPGRGTSITKGSFLSLDTVPFFLLLKCHTLKTLVQTMQEFMVPGKN